MKTLRKFSFYALLASIVLGLTACGPVDITSRGPYSVVFHQNDGSNDRTLTIEADTIIAEPIAPTRNGYTFQGWYRDSSYTSIFDFADPVVENLNLYAKWGAVEYTITYHMNDGTNGFNPERYTVETNTIVLEKATKGGYKFVGWYDNAEFSGDPVTKIDIGSFGDITLHAFFMTYFDALSEYFLENGVWRSDGYRIQVQTIESGTFTYVYEGNNSLILYNSKNAGTLMFETTITYTYGETIGSEGRLRVVSGSNTDELIFTGIYHVETNTYEMASSQITQTYWNIAKETLESKAISSVQLIMEMFEAFLEQEIGIPLG